MTMNEMDTTFLLARSDLGANWYQMKDSWLWNSPTQKRITASLTIELNKFPIWQGNLTRNEISPFGPTTIDIHSAQSTHVSSSIKHRNANFAQPSALQLSFFLLFSSLISDNLSSNSTLMRALFSVFALIFLLRLLTVHFIHSHTRG